MCRKSDYDNTKLGDKVLRVAMKQYVRLSSIEHRVHSDNWIALLGQPVKDGPDLRTQRPASTFSPKTITADLGTTIV